MIAIKKASIQDFETLADIWLAASIKAHHFIDQAYWEQNKATMLQHYLPMSEVYIAEEDAHTLGFIALVENTIAAIFVSPALQGKGIGTLLINHAKKIRTHLELAVYQENQQSVQFYQSMGFTIVKETIDPNTQAKEFSMCWTKQY